jgi:hypothetical protein
MMGAVAANRRRISAPWTGANVSITHLGGQEYQIAKTNGGNWNTAAWFPDLRDGDMRFRIQPQQTNAYIALGLTTGPGVTLDTGPLAEQIVLRGDGAYTASTSYTADAGPTYSYAANQFFWFERVGSLARIYVGGDGTFATAMPYHTFTTDASDTDRPKIAINLQNASVKVIYYPL